MDFILIIFQSRANRTEQNEACGTSIRQAIILVNFSDLYTVLAHWQIVVRSINRLCV